MGEIDTFGLYVRRRLEHWGHVFALDRDCEYLGHQSKNMLQVLIEHKGEMPGKVQGFKPLEVDQSAMQVELIVADIAREQRRLACILRAYYCGMGRRKVERYETALMLIANVERDEKKPPPLPNLKRYLQMADIGTLDVRRALCGISEVRRVA